MGSQPIHPDPTTRADEPRLRLARRHHTLALALTLIGLAVSIVLAFMSDGFHQDDDVCHFIFARDGWTDAHARWHFWARPGYNLPAMLAAHWFDLIGCRILSGIQTAIAAWLAWLIAARLAPPSRRNYWLAALAPALLWVQPLVMMLSATTLTETPAALYLAASVWLYLRGNRVTSCAFASLLFITRYDLLLMSPLLAGVVIYDAWRAADGHIGRMLQTRWLWAAAAAALWAPIFCQLMAIAENVPIEISFISIFSQPSNARYGSGTWFTFLRHWGWDYGLGLAILSILGAVATWRRGFIVWAWGLGMIAMHTLLFRFGIKNSGGYARFILPGAPLTAALATTGLAVLAGQWRTMFGRDQQLSQKNPKTHLDHLLKFTAVFLLLLTAAQAAYRIRPLKEDTSLHRLIRHAVELTQTPDLADRPLLTLHVFTRLLQPNAHMCDSFDDAKQKWRDAPPGTLFLWDSKYGRQPDSLAPDNSLHQFINQHGKRLLEQSSDLYRVELYERVEH